MMDSFLVIFSNISEQLFQGTRLDGCFLKVFFPPKLSPESVLKKNALKNLRNLWRNSSLGYIYFLILAKKTTPPLRLSWEFCEMF